jgi:hypothetical protein
MEKWRIASEQAAALLAIDVATLEHWRADSKQYLSREVLERLSLILGIYAALHAALPGELADIWISLPSDHPHFGGRSALAAMIEDGLPFMYQVRFNLDAEVFGSHAP